MTKFYIAVTVMKKNTVANKNTTFHC